MNSSSQQQSHEPSLWNAIGDIREAIGELRTRVTALEGLRNLKTSSPSSPAPQTGTPIQIAERIISILPSAREVMMWLIPRAIIFWGILEGWWAAGWHTIRTILGLG